MIAPASPWATSGNGDLHPAVPAVQSVIVASPALWASIGTHLLQVFF